MQQPDNISQDQPAAGRRPPTLFDFLEILVNRWKMIMCITTGAAVITALITMAMPNIFTAKTMIIPGDDDKGGMGALMAQLGGLASIAGGAIGTKTTGDLYVTMLKSETLKDPIIDRFKLMERYKPKYRADLYRTLDAKTVISLGKKDGVISIAVSDKEPKLAAELANAYVDELNKLATLMNMSKASDNRNFLEKRIAKARADLTKAEDALKEFQSRNKAISVSDQAKATIESVAQLRAQLAMKEVELGTLQRQFTDTSQDVKTAKTTVASLRAQIGSLEGRAGDSSSSIPNVGNVPQLGQEYLRLMREFKIQEAVVEMLTKQYEVAQISETKDVAPIQVLQKARVPERKTKPNRSLAVKLAAFAGFFFSMLLAFALDYWGKVPIEKKRIFLKPMGFPHSKQPLN